MSLREWVDRWLGAQSVVHTTSTGGGRLWRVLIGATIALLASFLLADLIWRPSKRGVELLAGLIFIGFGISGTPLASVGFAIAMLPYPMHTSVGSTTTLLILAIGVLVMIKRSGFNLASPFFAREIDTTVMGHLLFVILSFYAVAPINYPDLYPRMMGFIAAITLYYSILQIVRSPRAIEIALKVFMATATTVGLVSTLQTLAPGKSWLPPFFRFSLRLAEYEGSVGEIARVYASFPGISPFGEYVAISIILSWVLFRNAGNLYERAFWLGSIILLLIGLMGSATRMGVLTIAFGFSYMVVFGSRVIPRRSTLNVLFVSFSLLAISYSFISPLTERMEERLSSLGSEDSSTQSRVGVMEQAIEEIPEAYMLGHGLYIPEGTFRGHVSRNIHCLYLTLPYTIGIPGTAFFVAFLVFLFRRSHRAMHAANAPPKLREYMLGLHTALVMFIVYQLTSDYISQAMNMHIVWLRFALLLALSKIIEDYGEDFHDNLVDEDNSAQQPEAVISGPLGPLSGGGGHGRMR